MNAPQMITKGGGPDKKSSRGCTNVTKKTASTQNHPQLLHRPTGGKITTGRIKRFPAKASSRKPAYKPAYSLYSTDSEDQVTTANKSLDKCAKLLATMLDKDSVGPPSSKSMKPASKSKVGTKSSMVKNTVKQRTKVGGKEPAAHSKQGNISPLRIPTGNNNQTGEDTVAVRFSPKNQVQGHHQEAMLGHVPVAMESQRSSGLYTGHAPFNQRLVSSTPDITPSKIPNMPPGGGILNHPAQIPQTNQHFTQVRVGTGTQGIQYKTVPQRHLCANNDTNHEFADLTRVRTDNAQNRHVYFDKPVRDIDPQFEHLENRQNVQDFPFQCENNENQREVSQRPLYQGHQRDDQSPDHKWAYHRAQDVLANQIPGMQSPDQHGREGQNLSPVPELAQVDTKHPKKKSPSMKSQLKTLKHLLKELRGLMGIEKHSGDIEVQRLLHEIEDSVNFMSPGSSAAINLKAEIDLALQPLRSENCDLRRQLRIANQKLREKEDVSKEFIGPGLGFQLVHLQASNAALEKEVDRERKARNQAEERERELQEKLDRFEIERHKMVRVLDEKSSDHMKSQQDWINDASSLRRDLDKTKRLLVEQKDTISELEVQNELLALEVQNRDSEVTRLQSLVQGLQQSMRKLLGDLQCGPPEQDQGEGHAGSLADSLNLQQLYSLLQTNHHTRPANGNLDLRQNPTVFGPAGRSNKNGNMFASDLHSRQNANMFAPDLNSRQNGNKYEPGQGLVHEVDLTPPESLTGHHWQQGTSKLTQDVLEEHQRRTSPEMAGMLHFRSNHPRPQGMSKLTGDVLNNHQRRVSPETEPTQAYVSEQNEPGINMRVGPKMNGKEFRSDVNNSNHREVENEPNFSASRNDHRKAGTIEPNHMFRSEGFAVGEKGFGSGERGEETEGDSPRPDSGSSGVENARTPGLYREPGAEENPSDKIMHAPSSARRELFRQKLVDADRRTVEKNVNDNDDYIRDIGSIKNNDNYVRDIGSVKDNGNLTRDIGRQRPLNGDSNTSRYSVTDYFQKYPVPKTQNMQINIHDIDTDSQESRVTQQYDGKARAAVNVDNNPPVRMKTHQQRVYDKTELDNSWSTIDDVASVNTISTISTISSVDDRVFRSGLANLDANITKIQQALRKDMLNRS